MSAKEIVKAPKQVAINCINYWLDNLPDMSDNPTFNPKNIATLGRVKKDRRRLHCHLKGLVGRWVNITIDWAISLGLWAVKFTDKDGAKTDLVEMFSTAVWIRYVSLMCGKPTFKSNAAQKIFRYMIVSSCYYFLLSCIFLLLVVHAGTCWLTLVLSPRRGEDDSIFTPAAQFLMRQLAKFARGWKKTPQPTS